MATVEIRRGSGPRGFTLTEVMIAASVLSVAFLSAFLVLNRSSLLSEVNNQIKTALFDGRAIVEEILGIPFDEIMDPDYPTSSNPVPRFRHLQYVDAARLYGTNPSTNAPNSAHLNGELVRVWYGSGLDTSDSNGNGDRTDAAPLAIVTGSDSASYPLAPSSNQAVERYRPQNNSATLDEFLTPEPLYVTVEVSWIGPASNTRMAQRITFVRSR